MSSKGDPIIRLSRALEQVEGALADNIERGIEIQRRVQWFREEVAAGATVESLVTAESVPRAVEMLTLNAVVLETAGAEFRSTLAHALRAEGMTIEAIGTLFGVTRQRVSALLRQNPPPD